MTDKLGNQVRREGVDRCACGSKYWENDRCIDCGATEPGHGLTLSVGSCTTVRGNVRWCYCVNRPGWWGDRTDYRYHSEAAARKAGKRALDEYAAYLEQQET